MSKFKVGDKVTLKKAVDVHIDDGLTQIVPGEIGHIDWTDGNEMDVYFGDYVKLELYASQVKLAEPTDHKTAFLAELKELLVRYNASIQQDHGCFVVLINDKYVHTIEGGDEYILTADNVMGYDKEEV